MEPIQIVAIVFAVFSIAVLAFKYRKDGLTTREILFWTVAWAAVIVVATTPKVLNSLSVFLGVRRPIDLVVYLSIVALFYLIFRLYVKIHEIEREITEVVREMAKDKDRK